MHLKIFLSYILFFQLFYLIIFRSALKHKARIKIGNHRFISLTVLISFQTQLCIKNITNCCQNKVIGKHFLCSLRKKLNKFKQNRAIAEIYKNSRELLILLSFQLLLTKCIEIIILLFR